MLSKLSLVLLLIGVAVAQPIADTNLQGELSIWKDTPMEGIARDCVHQPDSISCFKDKILTSFRDLVKEESSKVRYVIIVKALHQAWKIEYFSS